MLYRKIKNLVTFLLFAFCAASAFAAQGQYEHPSQIKNGQYFRCAKGEAKEACLRRYKSKKHKHFRCANSENKKECIRQRKNNRVKGNHEQRKHIRRMLMKREAYKFYVHKKPRNYRHPVTNPYAGSKTRSGKGRMTQEQREELRRMINQVNQDRRYRRSN